MNNEIVFSGVRKGIVTAILCLLACISLVLSACTPQSATESQSGALGQSQAQSTAQSGGSAEFVSDLVSVSYDTDDLDASWSEDGATLISLEGVSAAVKGSGATVSGSTVTITAGGTYLINGSLSDGQIRVNSEDKKAVRLVLNGTDIYCSASAPIYVLKASKAVIILAEGSENHVSDGQSYVLEDTSSNEPNAAIFSKSDLTNIGSASLTVKASYQHGILSKDELKIISGRIAVFAAGDGIRGRDFVAVRDGDITIEATGDGIQSNNDEDAQKGFVLIEGGRVDIAAGEDGIQGETQVYIAGGEYNITTGGGSQNGVSHTSGGFGQSMQPGDAAATAQDSASAKGIKAAGAITITGGSLRIESSDDAIHSNNSIQITGGTIYISSGDDGIHADTKIEIAGGSIEIAKSYEGIESASIDISAGDIRITASDDGINIAGGNDASAMGGRPGQNSFNSSGGDQLTISGGYIAVIASGDGLDANGSIEMSGGTVIVSGPTGSGNGALDYDGSFAITGGLLVAAGSSGMAQAPGSGSTQNLVMITFDSPLPAGTAVQIQGDKGEAILTYVSDKQFQTLVFSSPSLQQGVTYTVDYGGAVNGSEKDGLYTGGGYISGTVYTSFTVSNAVTYAGASAGGQMGGGQFGGGRPAGGQRK